MVVTKHIHKKSSLDGNLTLYLTKRDIVDHISHVDPIEGIVLVDKKKEGQKVYGQVVTTFRYGREEDEVMGLHFSKDLYLISEIIEKDSERLKDKKLSKIQTKLMDKYGENAIPFIFSIEKNSPQSVLLSSYGDGKQCGVYYKIRVFLAENQFDDKPNKRNCVEMSIRKHQQAPVGKGKQPYSIIRKDFLFSPGELELEASLDKPLYNHGENIAVNVSVRNYSSKTVKRMTVSIVQSVDISMFTSGHYTVPVAINDTQEGCPIEPGSSLQKTFVLAPNIDILTEKQGIALEGDDTKESQRLASSTLIGPDQTAKDVFGVTVSYYAKVKLLMGAIAGELVCELPFLLMAPGKKEKQSEEKEKE